MARTVADMKAAALLHLKRYVQYATPPLLSDTDDLSPILDNAQKASFWVTATPYTYGQIVEPTIRNGHRYRCIYPGTSTATEPTWPLAQGEQVTDGTVLAFVECGPDKDSIFDVRQAIHEAWLEKAAKASVLISTKTPEQGNEAQQVYDHCMAMAKQFIPVGIA